MTSDLFAPPGAPWQRVSPALTKVRRILAIPPLALIAVVTASLAATGVGPGWLTLLFGVVAVVAVTAAAWTWSWAPRNTASWGYAEDEEDLLVTGGVMFRRLVAVPYGRMQFVDVTAGPVDRAFGIASVTLAHRQHRDRRHDSRPPRRRGHPAAQPPHRARGVARCRTLSPSRSSWKARRRSAAERIR